MPICTRTSFPARPRPEAALSERLSIAYSAPASRRGFFCARAGQSRPGAPARETSPISTCLGVAMPARQQDLVTVAFPPVQRGEDLHLVHAAVSGFVHPLTNQRQVDDA